MSCRPSVFSQCTYLLIAVILMMVIQSCGGKSDAGVDPVASEGTASVPTQEQTTVPTATSTVLPTPTSVIAEKSSEPTKISVTPVPDPTAIPEKQEVVSGINENIPVSVGPVSSGLDSSRYIGVCKDLDLDGQKAKLKEIVEELFPGFTEHDGELVKLQHPPDIRDRRRGGGFLINIIINGDERETVPEKKALLDAVFRDALEAVYRAECSELKEATIIARMNAIGAGENGPMTITMAGVFKVGLKVEQASSIDWGNKENLDFNTVWETLILHTRWRKELKLRPD